MILHCITCYYKDVYFVSISRPFNYFTLYHTTCHYTEIYFNFITLSRFFNYFTLYYIASNPKSSARDICKITNNRSMSVNRGTASGALRFGKEELFL